MNAYSSKELLKRQAIATYLQTNAVPQSLQKAIDTYYDYRGGVLEDSLSEQMPNLPRGLVFKLDVFQKRDIFLKVPIFQDLPVEMIMALVPKVALEDMMPGRTVVREGYFAEGMFMISRGKIQIFANGEMVAVRIPGEYVGEGSLVHNMPAKATCITADWCTLMVLRRLDFVKLSQAFPEMQRRLLFHMKQKEKVTKRTNPLQQHGAALKDLSDFEA